MGTFKSYKSDAWQEPEINKRYESDAWQDCEFAKRYISDAWEEVWTGMDVMTVSACTITNGNLTVSDDKTTFSFDKFEDIGQQYGSLSGDGYILFELEGNWTDPTVAFSWWGGMSYWSSDATTCSGQVGSTIQVSAINGNTTSGANTIPVGSTYYNATGLETSSGNFSYTFDGTFTKIQIKLNVFNFPASYYYGSVEATISSLYIAGEKVGFSPDAEAYGGYINDYD